MNEGLQKSKRRERFIRYAPLVLWLGVIFFLSSGQGATTQTSRFIRPLLEFLFPNAADETLSVIHGCIRKFAHFAEYAALAFLASRAFWGSSINRLRKFWWLAAFILIALTASFDEYNQSFNSARTGSVYDVFIDLSGGLTMILFLAFFKKKFSNPQLPVKAGYYKT